MVKVSIVITNFNGKRFLGNCLSSIYESKNVFDDFEVILVDNGSTDGSIDYVKNFFPEVKLIRNEKNLGFAKGNNMGIMVSHGNFIVLLNSDTIVTCTWLRELINTAENDGKVGIVGPKTLRFDRCTIDTTGHIFHHKLGEAENRGSGEIDYGQYDDETDVLGVQFSCALIRREVIDNVGLLDDKMFLYLEDVDYCIRTRLRGLKVAYCPTSIIYHFAGGSTPTKRHWNFYKHGFTNRLRVILKNYSLLNMLKWGSFGFVFYWVAIMASFKNRRWDWLPGYFYAFWCNLLNFPVKERIEVQRNRVVGDDAILRYGVKGRRW